MTIPEIAVAISAAIVLYAYVGYPLLLFAWPTRRSHFTLRTDCSRRVGIVIAAFNEQPRIGARLLELERLRVKAGLTGPILVVSDGSTDQTAALAAQAPSVRVLALPRRVGKARAVTLAVHHCGDVDFIVFADARQRWDEDTLPALLRRFDDPQVGAVSGALVLEKATGVGAGVGLYWRLETWMRAREADVHSMIGVTGAVAAVRAHVFRPIPQGTLLDDVYWPMQVVMDGFRVVFEPGARAYDRVPANMSDEFKRKVRTLTGNLQLLELMPSLLLPGRNPLFVQFVSHKLLRLVVPWALLSGAVATPWLEAQYAGALATVGGALLALGLVGLGVPRLAHYRVVSTPAAFLMLNAAAWAASIVWATGRSSSTWRGTASDSVAPEPS